ELAKGRVREERRGCHIKNPLWIIGHYFAPPACGGGSGGAWSFSSAGARASAREFAVGLVAAFVDAFQAFRDDCLQLRNFLLLFGFSGIHRNRFFDVY